jgi:hypothetical protein
VRFLVDAQLPLRFARLLAREGHDTLHTFNLPDGKRTPDRDVVLPADTDGRIVVTKDRDSREGHLLSGLLGGCWSSPPGTHRTTHCWNRSKRTWMSSSRHSGEADFVEIGPQALIVHRRCGYTRPN